MGLGEGSKKMGKTVIYILSDPTTKCGYIVADIDSDRGRLAKYLEDYKMTFGSVLTPEEYPDIFNILWYMQRVYNGYSWQIAIR